eukprot:2859945-Prymnesium_polylepis.2
MRLRVSAVAWVEVCAWCGVEARARHLAFDCHGHERRCRVVKRRSEEAGGERIDLALGGALVYRDQLRPLRRLEAKADRTRPGHDREGVGA